MSSGENFLKNVQYIQLQLGSHLAVFVLMLFYLATVTFLSLSLY